MSEAGMSFGHKNKSLTVCAVMQGASWLRHHLPQWHHLRKGCGAGADVVQHAEGMRVRQCLECTHRALA